MKKLLLFVTIAFMGIKGIAQAPTSGLVGYYNFADNLKSTIGSHSFTNGTATNVSYDAGKYGNGLYMGGSSALVNTSMITQATLSTNATVAWWEFRDGTALYPVFKYSFSLRGGLYYGYVGTSNCGAVFYNRYQMDYVTTTGNFCRTLNSHTGVGGNGGRWVHHAFTKEGTVVRYYMDGVLSWTPTTGLPNDNSPMSTPTANFVFGALPNSTGAVNLGTCMLGKLDELYIYDRALTASEVIAVRDFTGIQPATVSAITTSAIGLNSANINYTLNAFSSSTTSAINYGTSSTSLTNQIVGNTASGASNTPSVTTLTGLTAGTTYYYNIVATNASGNTTSTTGSFTTDLPSPSITLISTNSVGGNATIYYTLNAKGLTTTSIVKYGTSAASLINSVSGGSATGTSDTATTATLTGLTIGTTYYYQIEATNSAGNRISTINYFTVGDPATVDEYHFNNNWDNVSRNNYFINNGVFVADRIGNPDGALQLYSGGTAAAIANLPVGNTARTISIWVKSSLTAHNDNQIFNYGSASTNRACGLTRLNSDGKLYFYGYSNDLTATYSPNANNWIHYVTTYQPNGTANIYIDGVLFATGSKPGWDTISTTFKIGRNVANTDMSYLIVDDLKIYNRVLNPTEVNNLYVGNSILSTQNFNSKNLKASIYPNPATNSFTIDMENEVKSVEIYSLQGQKVMASKDKKIKIVTLSKGMYLVRIEDVNNAVSTQKLVVE